MPWTAPRTWTDGELVTKAIMDPHVRDNFLAVPHPVVRKTSNQTVTSSTVLVNDTALVLPVLANEVWRFEFDILYDGASAGDIKIAFTFPASGEIVAGGIALDAGGTVTSNAFSGTTTPTASVAYAAFGTGAGNKIFLRIPGVFINAGTGGSLTLQWAQQTSSATATTVYTNSAIWGARLA